MSAVLPRGDDPPDPPVASAQGDDPPRTWVEVLSRAATDQPDRIAFSFLADGEDLAAELSYARLDQQARAIGARLQELGLAGRTVLLLYPPGVDYVAGFFGCLYSGAIAVPAYPPSRRPQSVERLLGIISDCAATVALTTAEVAGKAGAAAEAAGIELLETDTIAAAYADRWTTPASDQGAAALVQYTSGSTGHPRGVMVSQQHLLANTATAQRLFMASASTRVVSWLPIYHDMGLIGSVLGTVHCGASCTLMSPVAFIQRPARWLEAISRTRATVSGGPDFAYEMCVERITDAERANIDLRSWEIAFDGAEPIRPATLRRFAEVFAPCGFRQAALTPCYGLAEATLLVTAKTAGTKAAASMRPPGGGSPVVSCGPPPTEYKVRIVDPERLTRCEDEEIGEIWVCSPSVAHGYLGKPQDSDACFRAVLDDEPGEHYLRTGDLGYLHAGELYVVGRIKDLIIVRGRNHYPQDIEEAAESAHAGLRRGGGAAFAMTVAGREELVVVHEVDRSYRGDAGWLAQAASAAIAAAHGVRPHAVILIKAGDLPRTSSGKVRRSACRASLLAGELPELARTEASHDAQAARPAHGTVTAGPAVDVLRAELASLLGRPVTADDQPLISLGLDSLGTLILQQRLQREFGRLIDFDMVAECTIGELAGLLEADGDAQAPVSEMADGPADQERAPGQGYLPLSEKQRSQWLSQQLAPESRRHIIAAAVQVRGPLDVEALRRALHLTVLRHPALRCTFEIADSQPVQHIVADLPAGFRLHDRTGRGQDRLRAELEEAAYQPFDLENGPLLRIAVFRTGHGQHTLVLAVHHLIADMWSIDLLLAELDQAYLAVVAGARLPDPRDAQAARTRADRSERAAARSASTAERMLAYWRAELAGAPHCLPLPDQRMAGAERRFAGDAVRVAVAAELTSALTDLARRERVTPYSVLMAAWQVALGKLTGALDLLVAAPVHGRDDLADTDEIGFFADVVPIRGRLSATESFASLARRTHRVIRLAARHAELPFAVLVQRLNPDRQAGRQPLVQAALTLHRPPGKLADLICACAVGIPGATGAFCGLAAESAEFTPPPSQFEIALSLAVVDGSLSGLLQFDPDLLDRARAELWAAAFTETLTALIGDPQAPISRCGLAGPPAPPRPQDARRGLRPAAARPLRPVHEQFAARAAMSPDDCAVIDGDSRVSYAELDARANRLAHRLLACGVAPESLVGLCLPRGADLVVAVLAIMKAGGAYLPLDPTHPADRVGYILGDAAPAVIIADESTARLLPRHSAEIVDIGAAETGSLRSDPPQVHAALDQLAYVIYTSGSTGRPKGVLVEHRGIANIFAAATSFGFCHTDVWTLFHSIAFDFSVWELWGPLIHGGTLVVVPQEAVTSPVMFWELVRRHHVTVLNQTPAVFAELTAACESQLGDLHLRHVIFGGEKLDATHLTSWRRSGDARTRLTNMYGITEITVHATWHQVEPDEHGPIGLGTPLAGTDLRLLAPDGSAVAPGQAGEICVGGAGVARGYLNGPAMTADRFVPHPEQPGGRMYRSGDLARLDVDGKLIYLGRSDDQVKIRGHRIEPAEIVAALRACPGVRQAVVLPFQTAGRTQLAAYLVTAHAAGDTRDARAEPTPAELRAHLRGLLPEFLVPSAFIIVPAIPLTSNGKVDRAALPPPREAGQLAGEPPATPTEVTIGRFIAEMLAIDGVGNDEDLFVLGWHSLLMARLALRAEQHFGVRIPLQTLFTVPTVRCIAAAVDKGQLEHGEGSSGSADLARAPSIVRADRSRYAARRMPDGTLALPDALTGGNQRRP